MEPPKQVTQPASTSPSAPPPDEEVPPKKRSKRKFPIIAVVICLILVGFILMVKFLPWWLSIVITVVVVFGTVLVAKFLFKRFFMGLFGAKGEVLAGATAQVHGISQAPVPEYPKDDEDEDDAEDEEGQARHTHEDQANGHQHSSQGDRLAIAKETIGDHASQKRCEVHKRHVEAVDLVALGRRQPETTTLEVGGVEQQDADHGVEGQSLPHLGEEEGKEPLGVS